MSFCLTSTRDLSEVARVVSTAMALALVMEMDVLDGTDVALPTISAVPVIRC